MSRLDSPADGLSDSGLHRDDIPFDPIPTDDEAPAHPSGIYPDDALPDRATKGRGAVSNATGRYEPETRIRTDDGWSTGERRHWSEALEHLDGEHLDDEPPKLRTTVQADTSRSVIAKNDSPDIPVLQSINPYRGCEHGCIYCFARPTHAYLGYSPGLDFETRLVAKYDAPRLLEEELRRPGYEVKTISIGTNTDAYQPIERDHQIMRGILEVLSAYNHPVGIVTKSALVMRDIDILASMAKRRLVRVFLSLTSLDPELARAMEPRAAAPHMRLKTLKALSEAGIPTGVMVAPMIPALNDAELESLLEAAWDAGARSAGYVLLRLPFEIKDLFTEWLWAHYPLKAEHVLSLIRGVRGGKLNDARFGSRMRGSGKYADLLEQRFQLATRRIGFNAERPRLRTDLFQIPPRKGDQLRLL